MCYGDSNCLPGELCIEGNCEIGCTSDAGCSLDQICINHRCKCSQGFIASPDKCLDIDECDDHPCHPTAECINLQGSYKCSCPTGTAGDPVVLGCLLPHRCDSNTNCPESLACVQHNCTDPCSRVDCGPNTVCSVFDHAAACQCQAGFIGDASGCFKVECLSNSDCPVDKFCNQDVNKCTSPCNQINCGYGNCIAIKHEGNCQCYPGFTLVGDTCVDVDECLQSPCHSTAM